MNITTAQYITNTNGNNDNIKVTIDGQSLYVPIDPANRHYAELLKQVKEGTLTIKEAE